MSLKERLIRQYEASEKQRKSPWNVVAFVVFVLLAVAGLLLNGGKVPSLFDKIVPAGSADRIILQSSEK